MPWPFDLPLQGLGIIADDLAQSLLWPEWFEQPQPGAVTRDQGWSSLPPRIAHEVLGMVAAVLTTMADTHARGAVTDQPAMANGARVDLAWLVRRLPADERRILAKKAKAWGPVLAEIVVSVIDGCDRVRHGTWRAREAPAGCGVGTLGDRAICERFPPADRRPRGQEQASEEGSVQSLAVTHPAT